MKEDKAFEYAQTRHGLSLNTDEVGVSCSLAGFMAGWEAAAKYVPTKPPIEKSYTDILNTVSEKLELSIEDLKSPCRDRDLVEARVVFAMIVREMVMKSSYHKIGSYVSRDHSCIVHYLKNLTELKSVKQKKDLCLELYYEKYI